MLKLVKAPQNWFRRLIGWIFSYTPAGRARADRAWRAKREIETAQVQLLRERFWRAKHEEWDAITTKYDPASRRDSRDAAAPHQPPRKILPFEP